MGAAPVVRMGAPRRPGPPGDLELVLSPHPVPSSCLRFLGSVWMGLCISIWQSLSSRAGGGGGGASYPPPQGVQGICSCFPVSQQQRALTCVSLAQWLPFLILEGGSRVLLQQLQPRRKCSPVAGLCTACNTHTVLRPLSGLPLPSSVDPTGLCWLAHTWPLAFRIWLESPDVPLGGLVLPRSRL